MTTFETLRKNYIDQFNEVGKALEAKHEELAKLEKQLEQIRGAIFAMDRLIQEAQSAPVAVPTTELPKGE